MFRRRRLDPEKTTSSAVKCTPFRIMVVIRFEMRQIPSRNSTLEEKIGYISTLKH